MEEKKELLTPKTDVVFHSLFRVGNEEITKAIISDIIEDKIESIDLDNDKYLVKEYTKDKLGILDLKAKLNNGTICNIEVQLIDKGNTIPRFLWYWSKVNGGQLKETEDYNDLEKCISILILDYELKDMKELVEIQELENLRELEQMEECHTEWQIFEKKRRKILLTKLMEIHIIEIPKAIKMLKKQPQDRIAQWMAFLDNPNKVEVSKIMEENKDIEKAMGKLKEVSEDEKMRRIAELREKAILDERSARRYAIKELEEGKKRGREEGRQEGLQEGRQEGLQEGIEQTKREIVKKLLKKNMSISEILEITDLTKDEIEKIIKL